MAVRLARRENVLMSDLRWYAIQTTAGHENKVRNLIARRISEDTRPEAEKPIRQALVPTQEVVEIKNGKKVNVERKLYPGYVLVEMAMNQETIHTINSIQGVIKFVGHDRLPQPVVSHELDHTLDGVDGVNRLLIHRHLHQHVARIQLPLHVHLLAVLDLDHFL